MKKKAKNHVKDRHQDVICWEAYSQHHLSSAQIGCKTLLANSYTSFMMAHKSCRSQKSPTLIQNKFEKCLFLFAQVSSKIKCRNLYIQTAKYVPINRREMLNIH